MCIVYLYIYINQYICQFLYHRHCWKALPECPLFARTLLNSRPSWRLKFGVDLGSCHPGWRSQPSGGLMKFNEIDFVYLDTLENLLGNLTSQKITLIFIIFIFERPTCKLRKEEAKKMEFVIWCWVVFSLNPLGPSLNVWVFHRQKKWEER